MIRTKGLAHMSIPVTDLERSQNFYCNVLGLKFIDAPPNSGMTFLDAGRGDCVILVQVDQPISTAHLSAMHHAFIVAHDEYEAARSELQEHGVKVIFEEDRRGGVVNGPRFYFEDPDGNRLEIIDLSSYKGDLV